MAVGIAVMNRREACAAALAGGIGAAWRCASAATAGSGADSRERALAEQRMQTCTAANARGVGLQAEYFDKDHCQGIARLVRVEGPVEFDPASDVEARGARSARWRGWIKPPLPGLYGFHANHREARIVLAHQAFDGRSAGGGLIALAAGRFYPVLLEAHGLRASPQGVRLEWTAPHGMRYLVPRASLFLPT